MALTYTPDPSLGSSCPDFKLPATDNRTYSLEDFKSANAILVMFICNHCPYVQAVEDRLISLGRDYQDRGVAVVAISSNDSVHYPADSFDKMKERAEAEKYTFPYLFDESQSVAKSFGAVCTPDFFLYDSSRRLAYRGRLDDSWKDVSLVKKAELRDAIDAVLLGSAPRPIQNPSMGCSIKWKNV